jgi:nicotinate phosphoribosyltransferase
VDDQGRLAGDTLGLATEDWPGRPLLVPVMRGGRRLEPRETLARARGRASDQLATLPDALRGLDVRAPYAVEVTESVKALAAEVDRRT